MKVRWHGYDESEDTWEDAKLVHENNCLVQGLLKITNYEQLPDFDVFPTKKVVDKKQQGRKNESRTNIQHMNNECRHKQDHQSNNDSINIDCLIAEDNKDYIKCGSYLHENHCRKCRKNYVLKIKETRNQITITSKTPAWRCPGTTLGCTYVWCNQCYKRVLGTK